MSDAPDFRTVTLADSIFLAMMKANEIDETSSDVYWKLSDALKATLAIITGDADSAERLYQSCISSGEVPWSALDEFTARNDAKPVRVVRNLQPGDEMELRIMHEIDMGDSYGRDGE